MSDVASAPLPAWRAVTRSRSHGGRTAALRWRLIRDEPRRGAANMALDHALADCLGEGEAVVRLYGWSSPTVSFGKNEPAAPVADAEARLDYVRRPTGGRAVLHAEELTYAVVAPLDAFGGLREAYVQINQALAEALCGLGAEVEVVGEAHGARGRTPGPEAGPCFRTPARGEVVASGRKLVGSAQARLRGALLQHGSILVREDQRLLGTSPSGAPPVTLAELLGNVSLDSVAEAVADALRERFGGGWVEGDYEPRELEAAGRREAERYGRDEWTWRR